MNEYNPENRPRPSTDTQALLAELRKQHKSLSILTTAGQLDLSLEPYSSGILALDCVLGGGIYPRKIYELYGAEASGKAQPLDSIVYTPDGPRTMRSLKRGESVCTPDGGSAKILAVYPQGLRPVYELIFKDGRKVRADENHLWKIQSPKFRDKRTGAWHSWEIVTTKRLYSSFRDGRKHNLMSAPLTDPVQFKDKELLVDPWMLGYFLGNGMMLHNQLMVSTSDQEIVEKIQELIPTSSGLELKQKAERPCYTISGDHRGWSNPLIRDLKNLGVYGYKSFDKGIPEIYMNASVEQRLALVQGLMDSDGTADAQGTISFCSTSLRLAKQMQELVWSLGGIARISERHPKFTYKGEVKDGRIAYQVNIRHKNSQMFFSLDRKKERCFENQYSETLVLDISDIQYIGEEETQCILIDHPEHLYLTDGYVVTHNSLCLYNILSSVQKAGKLVAIYDAERSSDTKEWLEFNGVDIDNLIYIVGTAEVALDALLTCTKNPNCGIISIDSIASMATAQEMEHEMEKREVATISGLLPKFFKKFGNYTTNTSMILINQVREAIGTYTAYGEALRTPGGRSVRHWASSLLEVRGIRKEMTEGQGINQIIKGVDVYVKAVKNRLGVEGSRSYFRFVFDQGIDEPEMVLRLAKVSGLLKQGGAWVKGTIKDEDVTFQGLEGFRTLLKSRPEFDPWLRTKILESYKKHTFVTKEEGELLDV